MTRDEKLRLAASLARLAALALLPLVLAACSSRRPAIDWRQAAQCRGQICTLRGTVSAAEKSGNVVRLYFDPAERDISVALVRGWLSHFPESPERYYVGREIVATGKVRGFHQQTELVARDADDIEVVAPPTSAPLATSTPPAAPRSGYTPSTPAEIEELRQRVRDLERRLHQLEAK